MGIFKDHLLLLKKFNSSLFCHTFVFNINQSLIGTSTQLLVIALRGLALMLPQTAWHVRLLQLVFLQGMKHSERDRHYYFLLTFVGPCFFPAYNLVLDRGHGLFKLKSIRKFLYL
jgi:hypothetical protein